MILIVLVIKMAFEKLNNKKDRKIGSSVIKVISENSKLTKKDLLDKVSKLVEEEEVGQGRISLVVSKLEDDEIEVEKRRGKRGYKYKLTEEGHKYIRGK